MSDTAILVQGMGKRYRLGRQERYRTLRDTLSDGVRAPFARLRALRGQKGAAAASDGRDFWALSDLSFEVKQGEVLGVIGRNGAGKSTLLKILSRITEPTTGLAQIHGRVGSLLEVGTGFHPELTGRENIFLNGAIIGMRRAEIQRKFDEIVAFAGVEPFLDTPVKRYSSGMYVRLAFAVAAHLEPEVLIIDEVLAVGDAEFQQKCIGRMQEVGRTGRTVLFVSHNLPLVERLCTHAILLKGGRLVESGQAHEVVSKYLGDASGRGITWTHPGPLPATPHFRQARLCYADGTPCQDPASSDHLGLELEVFVPAGAPTLIVAAVLKNAAGVHLFSTSPEDCGATSPNGPGLHRCFVTWPAAFLMPKLFSVTFAVYSPYQPFHEVVDGISFTVLERASLANVHASGRYGELQVPCAWTVSSMALIG